MDEDEGEESRQQPEAASQRVETILSQVEAGIGASYREEEEDLRRPGAHPVRGIASREEDDDDNGSDGDRHEAATEVPSDSVILSATLVDEEEQERRMRERIMAAAVPAEVVDEEERERRFLEREEEKKTRCAGLTACCLTILSGLVVTIVGGIITAIVVPLVMRGDKSGKDASGRSLCDPNPCQNGGICVDDKGDDGNFTYKCECLDGYRGALCDDDLCSPNPCHSGGSCIREVDGISCSCLAGYDGKLCENVLCSPDLCKNGGTCSKEEGNNDVACFCLPGYSGDRCEISLVNILFPSDGSRVGMGINGINKLTASQDDRNILVAEIRVTGEAFDAQNNRLSMLDWVTRDNVRGKRFYNDFPADQHTTFEFHGTCDCLNSAWAILNPSGTPGSDTVQFFWVTGCEPSPQAAPGTPPRTCTPSFCPEGCGKH